VQQQEQEQPMKALEEAQVLRRQVLAAEAEAVPVESEEMA
jgi:hypothetical protein